MRFSLLPLFLLSLDCCCCWVMSFKCCLLHKSLRRHEATWRDEMMAMTRIFLFWGASCAKHTFWQKCYLPSARVPSSSSSDLHLVAQLGGQTKWGQVKYWSKLICLFLKKSFTENTATKYSNNCWYVFCEWPWASNLPLVRQKTKTDLRILILIYFPRFGFPLHLIKHYL